MSAQQTYHIVVDDTPLCQIMRFGWFMKLPVEQQFAVTEHGCGGYRYEPEAELAAIVIRKVLPGHTAKVVAGPCSENPYWKEGVEDAGE